MSNKVLVNKLLYSLKNESSRYVTYRGQSENELPNFDIDKCIPMVKKRKSWIPFYEKPEELIEISASYDNLKHIIKANEQNEQNALTKIKNALEQSNNILDVGTGIGTDIRVYLNDLEKKAEALRTFEKLYRTKSIKLESLKRLEMDNFINEECKNALKKKNVESKITNKDFLSKIKTPGSELLQYFKKETPTS